MRNKLILFLMLALFGSTSFLRADEVTIGSGEETNSYLPSYAFYNYSLTQQIYTADEIGVSVGGTITSIAFFNGGTEKTRTYDMYLVNTDKETFASTTDWFVVGGGDKVFSGSVVMVAGEWTTITLDTPFEYDGNNLAVIMDDNTGSWSSGMECRVFAATSQALRIYSDGVNYDPSNPASYAGTIMDLKNQIVMNITPHDVPTPPSPTGDFAISPNDVFALGDRPVNGWMEPFEVRITNGGDPTLISTSMSNTSGETPFLMDQINNMTIGTDEDYAFEVAINPTAPEGDYAEEFTMFYAVNNRDILTIPVNGKIYTAVEPDIVEKAAVITWSVTNDYNNTPEVTAIHPNYNLPGLDEKKNDVVYEFTLAKDSKFSAGVLEASFIGIYEKTDDFQLTADLEPVVLGVNGQIIDQTVLAGTYYLVIASDYGIVLDASFQEIPAPAPITYVDPSPANAAMEVNAPVTLAWTGGDDATEYQVLFGTVYPPTVPVLDWTMVDDNYGSYTINSLLSNTQYFWQIKVRNSNGQEEGEVRGFTTTLTTPNTVTASATEIFTDGSTLIKWKHSVGTGGALPETMIGTGSNTNSYLPTYNLYNYSLTQQIYTGEEIGGAGTINSISFYPAGTITRELDIYLVNTTKTSFANGTDWIVATADDLVFSGSVAMVPNTWVTVTLNEPFSFDGSNLALIVDDNTGTWTSSIAYGVFDATGQAINVYNDNTNYNPATPQSYSGTVRNFKNRIIINKDGAKAVAQDRTFKGFNVYYSGIKANTSLITEKQYLLENLPYNMAPGHDIRVTAVYDEGESTVTTDDVIVKVSGYGTFTGTVTELISGQPVAGATVKFVGRDEFQNGASFQGTTNASGVYTIQNVKAGTYQGTATLEGMEPSYSASTVLAYTATETVNFVMHEEYKPVLSVYAEEVDPSEARVKWSLNTEITGGGNGNGGNGGNGGSFTEGFENGMPAGWNVIDGNNDGYTWCLTSAIPSTWTYYASLTLDWYRTGTNAICSGSYINGVGAITPNEYLVTPQVTISNGSTFSFWAAATDASYPADHFGVAVSDNGTDWTMVQEWTLTAKGTPGAGGRESRDGNGAKLGSWYNYTVDLSSYAGQKYIAIRHFNCTDQYIMCVDDIELSNGSKNRDVQSYTVVRKAILKENGIVPADSVGLVEGYTDTIYADFTWNNMEAGLYQYGVRAHYPLPPKGNRGEQLTVHDGTATNGYVPVYGFYADAYLKSEMVYPATELSDMVNGTINSMKFYASQASASWGAANFQVFIKEVDNTTLSAFTGADDATLVYQGPLSISGSEMLVEFTTPYEYLGGNLLVGFYNTVEGSYVTSTWYGENVSGASVQGYSYSSLAAVSPTQRNFLPKTTFDYSPHAGGNSNDNPVTALTWSNILPKDMDAVAIVNGHIATGSLEGASVSFVNQTPEESGFNFNGTMDETGVVTFDNFRKGEYILNVTLEDYTSDLEMVPVSVWNDTVIYEVHFEEICKPVESLTVSPTGYAQWTNMLPGEPERVAERYHVKLNNIFVTETTENTLQLEDLTVGETYTAAVAVVYSTGMSPWVEKTFTYIGCEGVATQVEDLEATNEPGDKNVILTWNGGTPTPPTPPTPPTGDVTIKLTAHNVWGDGTGYQMLLDDTHTLYGSTIPTSGALSTNCSGNEAIYAQFSHKIPTNADGNCTTSNMVLDGTVEITIPAGTYDWCIVNPTPGDRLWIAASNGNVGGRYDDYVFEGGHTYEFTVSMYGSNDGVDVSISGKSLYQPNMGLMSLDNRTNNETISTNMMIAGQGFGEATNALTDDGTWYYYDNGVNEDAIGTGGGNFWWGIMLPAGSYEGNKLTKVSAYDYMAMTGNVNIYQGGTTAPAGASLGQTNVTFTGSQQFVEFEFAEPIMLDPDQNVWVVFYNGSGANYPAAVCTNTGNANGRWVSLDGTTWEDLASYNLNYTFMIRAYIEQGGGGGTAATNLVPGKFNIFVDGVVVGNSATNSFTYEAPDFLEHEYTVIYIDANYGMSCPATIIYGAYDNVGEGNIVNAFYPNPTNSDLHVKANGMNHISVVNALGQVVYSADVNADEVVLNMAKYNTGIYMVNIVTNNGTAVKRVVVTK